MRSVLGFIYFHSLFFFRTLFFCICPSYFSESTEDTQQQQKKKTTEARNTGRKKRRKLSWGKNYKIKLFFYFICE